jgi:hypothetical protein
MILRAEACHEWQRSTARPCFPMTNAYAKAIAPRVRASLLRRRAWARLRQLDKATPGGGGLRVKLGAMGLSRR